MWAGAAEDNQNWVFRWLGPRRCRLRPLGVGPQPQTDGRARVAQLWR